MKTLKTILSENTGRVYAYLEDEKARKSFVCQAESEGFTFCDGCSLSSREIGDIMAINRDFTINFVGFIGRIAFQCAEKVGNEKLHKINYNDICN